VQRRLHQKASVDLAVASDCEKTPIAGELTKASQERLVSDLKQTLAELDSFSLSIAAIHVEAAISAIKDAKI
jgi:hypothetical protein